MDYKELFFKPVVSGGVSAVAFRQMFGPAQTITLYGKQMSVTAVGGIIGFVASFLTEVATMTILPHITKDARLRHYESLVLTLGTSGAVFWAIPRFFAAGGEGNTAAINQNLVLIGVLSEVLSQWIYESFFTGSASLFG